MDSIFDLWRQILPLLHDELGETVYNVWIKPIVPVEMSANELLLKVPSPMHRDIISGKFTKNIKTCMRNLIGIDISVKLITEAELKNMAAVPPEFTDSGTGTGGSGYEYTFDTFIVGTSNHFAHAAAQAVSENPGGAYNPLFIWGPPGLGKTHLLFAIREHLLRRDPTLKIIYIKGDQFTNELIESIGDAQMAAFRQKYRYVDVMLMDDIQFIAGKESTQEEFFHTFNALFQEHKQIVLTSDRPPKEIQLLEERLRSRFESGLIADIQPPELETRIAIVKRKAQQLGLDITDSIAEFIAQKMNRNIRQLEGVVKKINILCTVNHERPSLATAQTAIKDVLSDEQPLPLTIQRIVDEVSRSFEVQGADIYSDNQSQPVSKARQAAMYCVREITNMSFKAIGREFGGRDHTTVIYAVQQVKSKMNKNHDFRMMIEDIIKNIRS